MCVCRINKTRNYTVMSNYHLQDKRLTMQAKGLLSFMLSLPDDWDYTVNGLAYFSNDGVWRVTNTLNELKRYGYLIVTKLTPDKTKSGRIEYVYDIFEESQIKDNFIEKKSKRKRVKSRKSSSVASSTRRGFSSLEKTSLENCAQQNTNIPNTKETKYEKKKEETTEVSTKNINGESKEKNIKEKDHEEKIEVDIKKEKKEEKKEISSTEKEEREEVKNTKKMPVGTTLTEEKETNNFVSYSNTESGEKSIGSQEKKEENFVSEKASEKSLESAAGNIVKETDKQIKEAKAEARAKRINATEEEIEQSESVVYAFNYGIKKYTKVDVGLTINQETIQIVAKLMRQGFKEEDFYRVIGFKIRTWLGTPMAVQLKPSVLLGEKHFKEYLHETKLEQLTNKKYKVQTKEQKFARNRFANFDQREWDFKKIEEMAWAEYERDRNSDDEN